MANECKVYQQKTPRSSNAPLRVTPWIAYSALSTGGTVTLNKSTTMVTIQSAISGAVDFEAADGTDPDGTLGPFAIAANTPYDFDVKPGSKIRFD